MTHNTGQFTCQGCYVLPLSKVLCNVKEIIFMTGSYLYTFQVSILLIIAQVQA